MKTKRFFVIIEKDGAKRRTDSILEADSASRKGCEVTEIVKLEVKIRPTTIKATASTPY